MQFSPLTLPSRWNWLWKCIAGRNPRNGLIFMFLSFHVDWDTGLFSVIRPVDQSLGRTFGLRIAMVSSIECSDRSDCWKLPARGQCTRVGDERASSGGSKWKICLFSLSISSTGNFLFFGILYTLTFSQPGLLSHSEWVPAMFFSADFLLPEN